MSTEPESFITRWSRRKREAERDKEQPAESTAPDAPAAQPVKDAPEAAEQSGSISAPGPLPAPTSSTEVPLPPIESLDGLRSDYQAFFQQPVAEDVRHAALKKLFADPHFNKMDMLDVYVDDYTQFEPLPEAMKLRLVSARNFLLDSERAALDVAETQPGAANDAMKPSVAGADEDRAIAAKPDDEKLVERSDSNIASTPAPTAASDVALPSVGSADDSKNSTDGSTSSAHPGKSAAGGPTSS